MKNFTKEITNKALFKPTRWLLVALMFLLGTSGAWAATVTFTSDDVLFFNMSAVSWWTAGTNGNGNFAYFYNNSTGKNAWSAHAVQYSGSVYYVKIPAGTWEGVILTRNNTSTAPSWNNKWNQTGDIALNSTSNYISKFSEGSTSVTWSTQKPTSTGTLTASSASVNTNINVTLTPSLTSNTTYNEIKSTTYAISPSTGASVSGNTFTATAAGTYTVTATITYNPRGYSSLTSTVSSTVTITVTDPCPSSVTPGTASGAKTICSGGSATVSLSGNTSGSTIQWQKSTTSSTSGFANINGATNSSYTANNLTQTTYFRAVVTLSKNGCDSKTANSGAVTITVNSLPAAPTLSPNTDEVCSGKPFTLPGDYNWYEVSTGGTKLNSATISGGITSNKSYWAEAKNASGCVSSTRTEYTVTVNNKPGKPTLGASNTALVAGDNAILTVSNTETGATYTLYKDGVSTGKTGTSFTVNEAGSYTVKGKNDCGESDASTAVVITVCNPIKSAKLYFADSNYNKLDACPTYCAGSTAYFVLEYTGERDGDKTWTRSDNFATNLKGTEEHYYFTINTSGSISVTIPTCDGTSVTTNTLTYPTANITTAPATPTVSVITNEVITCNETSFVQKGKIQITNYSANNDYIIGDNDNSPVNVSVENDKAYIYFDFGGTFTLKARNKACSLTGPKSAQFTITESDNAPTITGNNSFQPGGSTVLTSDKGANTTWKASGGKLSAESGASVTFSADENGKYTITAIYNDCETDFVVSVQDDIYVWMRKPNKKENAYNNFYYINENPTQGGMMYYKEFTSKPTTVPECNQGGREADKECTDKEGYTWYGYVISKEAIENEYYFTVHAANPGGKNGIYTHTLPYKLEDVTSDLYFVMDESGSNDGWYINAPVVVRASGDASYNGNNFADFVPLYVKDANTCNKEVVSFEWQKSASQNGTYTTYKSGKGINNIRTREAGWYRCVVTYHDASTGTSNAIQVTNAGGTAYSFTSNLPIVMVNTNGVGFPDECTVTGGKYPSAVADKMKEKISVDVIIKKGNQILYDKKARMNYRGSSSLNFKKKSYAFVSGQDSCVFDKSRHDYVKTKKAKMLNILGQSYDANDKDWVMYAATADPSMIRNRLVFDLYQKMRPNDWGVHSTYVELVVDGEYKGVYVFMDKITANENRVNIVDGTGFIVKWDKTDVVDRYVDGNQEDSDEKTFATSRTGKTNISTYDTKVDQLFEIEYPEKEDIVDAGGSWSGTVATIKQRFEDFETALEAKNYEQVRAIIDYDSWADWFILNEFTKNLDAYRASCIFSCKGQGYKIQAVPLWDQELSFNNAAANISGKGANSTSGLLIQNGGVYSDAFPAPFWFTGGGTSITGGLLNDPCFVSLVKEKWATYTADGGVLTSVKVNEMVDAYKADLGAIGTNTTPIYRENQMIPFNNNTNAGRGATSSCTGSQAIGYFGYGENCGAAVTHDNSITAIKNWIPARITGLTSALNPLEGEALIFLVSPATQDVTPWQTALVSVQAPSGYTYTIDYSAITAAGGEVKENNNTYAIKLPRPNGWAVGGNGDNTLSIPYQISASIEVDDEGNACGTTSPGGEDTKTATITLKDELEDCDEPVVRQ